MPDPKGSGSTRREFVGGRLPQRMAVLQIDKLDAVADRGYFNGFEILWLVIARGSPHPVHFQDAWV